MPGQGRAGRDTLLNPASNSSALQCKAAALELSAVWPLLSCEWCHSQSSFTGAGLILLLLWSSSGTWSLAVLETTPTTHDLLTSSFAYWVFFWALYAMMDWRLLFTQCREHKNAWGCCFLWAGRLCFSSALPLLQFPVCLLWWIVAPPAHPRLEAGEPWGGRGWVAATALENTDDPMGEKETEPGL